MVHAVHERADEQNRGAGGADDVCDYQLGKEQQHIAKRRGSAVNVDEDSTGAEVK